MAERVKTREYRSALRAAQARQTRHAILEAARHVFAAHGYSASTVAQIAAAAGVAVDTVYASVGPKPMLFRLLLEAAISGADEAVPAEERDYVRQIRAAPTARKKIETYARAVRAIAERMAPLYLILRDAAPHAPDLARIRDEISARRAANMRRFAADLMSTGELRPELTVDEIADVVWSTNSAEFYSLLVRERGWSAEQFERWLADAWIRLFLAKPG